MSSPSEEDLRRRLVRQVEKRDWDGVGATGIALADAGDIENAQRAMEMAAEQGHAIAAFNLARLLAMQTRWYDALRWFDRAAQLGDTDGWIAAGNLAADTLNDYEMAQRFYGSAADSGNPSGLLNFGIDLVDQGHPAEAIEPLRSALKYGLGEAEVVLGRALGELGEVTSAVTHLITAARSGQRDAWAELGDLYQDTGQPDLAQESYERAIAAGDTTAYSALGLLLATAGHPEQAERIYKHALQEQVWDVLLNYGNLLLDTGRTAEAQRIYELAIASGNPEGHANLGALYEADGDNEEALREYRRGARLGDKLAEESEQRLKKDIAGNQKRK